MHHNKGGLYGNPNSRNDTDPVGHLLLPHQRCARGLRRPAPTRGGDTLARPPGLGAFSHRRGSALGATANFAVHDAFITLPPYTKAREGEVHELGLGGRNCSRPVSATSERMEREGPATSAQRTARCASRGKCNDK